MAAGCKQQTKKEKKKDKVHTQTKIGILQYELLNDYMKHYNKKKKFTAPNYFMVASKLSCWMDLMIL